MKGTAQRTENEIIPDTPAPVDKSAPIAAIAMTTDIAIEISQNSLQPLMALFFNASVRSKFINSIHFPIRIGRILTIFPFSSQMVVLPDRSRQDFVMFVVVSEYAK
jgi:hypothetical protein